ncbi:MAG TPA: putative Ig domain-containing protein, partial [Terracidiphilus sp.]|nr:putative Ig domain-containing protein [Terracidiphilus sp.]
MGLTATVANDKNAAGVTWTLSGAGALSNNTTSSVTYTAPAATSASQTITITATSIADPTKTKSATVTVPAMPTVTTSSLTAATVGTAYTTTLAGSGGISPYKWSLKSGTLPASMSLTAAGVLSGTPMAADAGAYNLTVQLTDSGTATALTATKALTLTVNAAPAIAFTTTSLAQGTYNQAYSATVAATGGAGTLTYSLAGGPLPTGVTLSSAGVISGTPTVTGTFPITVKASDAFGDSGTQGLSLKVVYPALSVTTNSLPTGYVGTNYSQQLTATGGSGAGYTWAMATGSNLPAGLTLSSGGLISGKPTTAATTSFTVMVTDSGSNTANGNLSITVNPGVTISTGTSLPTGYVGSSYSQQLAATGGTGTGYVWTVSSGSSIPAGLTLSSSGLLSGKPSTSGTPSFGITVTDSASNTASATFSMTISPGVTITTTSLPAGYQGGVYSGATLSAIGGSGTGYSWTWAAASGSSLPAGLVLSSGGAISGTPTASGTFNITFTVTDSANNTASTTLALTVEASLSVTTTTLPSGTVGVAYSQQLAATGGSGTYTWSTNAAGTTSLAGIGLALASTGAVTGTTPTAGTATFSATVTDSASHTTSATVTVTVYSALTVTTTTLPSANAGVAYSQQLAAAGGTGTGETWTVTAGSSSLTAVGLSLSSSGVVSGTAPIQGTASFTVQVTDSGSHTATQALSVTVYSALSLPPPNPSSLPSTGTTGVFYSGTINASGGSGNYSWAVSGLSDGLTSNAAGGTLTVSGTPTAAATVTFNVVLTDTTTSNSITQLSYMVVVSNPQPLVLPAPNPSSLPAATVSQAYVGSIQATGGVGPYTWKINGTTVTGTPTLLSNGLSATNTGGTTLSIGGTPTSTTSVSLTSVTVTDSEASPVTAGPDSYTIAVNSAGQNVSGQITLVNSCGSGTSVPAISVKISNGSYTATTSSDSSGNYSFSNVPNGTYTITPSISGPSSVFLPATQPGVVVNNADVTGENFGVSLGYTVSGTVAYSGTQSGRIYVELIGNCGELNNGTSLTAAGAYTIRGVAPGTYTVQSWMDPSTLGEGGANDLDPVGTASTTVTTANQTNVNVTLADPTQSLPTTSPSIQAISPTNGGVVLSFGGGSVTDSTTGKELFTSYTVQWSTSSSSGFSSSNQATFKAIGTHQNVWIINASVASFKGALTNGTAYYFRIAGTNSAGMGPWRTSSTAVTIGAPSTGNTVSGAVTIPNTVTVAAGAVLYVGYYDQSTNTAYATATGNP